MELPRGRSAISDRHGRWGHAKGFAEGLRSAVQTACTLLGIPLGPHERDHLDSLDAESLESLLVYLETERCWPSR